MSVDSPPPPSPVPTSDGPVPPPPNVALSVQGVSRWFGDVVAVSDVSFSVSSGVTALLGMLASCAAGISVVGIDNGYGAAVGAMRMLSLDPS